MDKSRSGKHISFLEGDKTGHGLALHKPLKVTLTSKDCVTHVTDGWMNGIEMWNAEPE